jgi:RHS repeat-associated protein
MTLMLRKIVLGLAVLAGLGVVRMEGGQFRLASPPSFPPSSGLNVNPLTGQVTYGIPLGVVPGDVPVAVNYRLNATPMTQLVEQWGTVPNTPAARLYGSVYLDRPASGTIHFGYIVAGVGDPYSLAITQSLSPVGEPTRYVLEDGRSYTSLDLVPYTSYASTFTLSQDFGLVAKTPAQLQITNDFSCVMFTASSADLGPWANKLVAPSGYGTLSSTYTVVMDKDKARIFQNGMPLLWIDKYNHWVGFRWVKTSQSSGGYTAVHLVDVTNAYNRGVRIQWADPVSSAQAFPQTLLSVDWLNMKGPSLRMTGYYGTSTNRPTGLPGSNNFPTTGAPFTAIHTSWAAAPEMPVSRPTSITIGESIPITPNWGIYPSPPSPVIAANTNDTTTADATTAQTWQFVWGTDGSMSSVTSPLGLTSTLTYGVSPTNSSVITFSDLFYASNANGQRSVAAYFWGVSLVSDSAGGTNLRNRSWDRSGSYAAVKVQEVCGPLSSATRTTELSFASTVPQFQANGALTGRAVYQSSGATYVKKMAQETYTLSSWGLDGSYSVPTTVNASSDGQPASTTQYTQVDAKSPVFSTVVSTVTLTSGSDTNTTNNTYESVLDKLVPYRLKTSLSPGATTPAKNQYDGLNRLVSSIDAYNVGTFYTYNTVVGDPAYGRLQTVTTRNQSSTPTTPAANVKTLSYDSEGRLSCTTTTFLKNLTDLSKGTDTISENILAYDASNRAIKVQDGRGVQSTTAYDVLGRPTSLTKDGEASVSYAYDPANLTSKTSSKGLSVVKTMDGLGRVMSVKTMDATSTVIGAWTQYGYDIQGRLCSTTDSPSSGTPRNPTSSTFDALDRPVIITYPDKSTKTFSYGATGLSETITMVNINGNITAQSSNVKTGQGQVTIVTKSKDGTLVANATEVRNGQGQVVTRLISGTGLSYGTSTYYAYGADGNVTGMTRDGEIPRNTTLGPQGLPTFEFMPETMNRTWTGQNSNDLGLPTSLVETGRTSGIRTRSLVYDGLGRLVKMANGADSISWTYVGANLVGTSSTTNGSTVTQAFTYQSAAPAGSTQNGRRLKSEQTTLDGVTSIIGYGWDDANGRLQTLTYPHNEVVTYTYDGYSRVKSVHYTTTASKVIDIISDVAYGDGWGNRTSMTYGSGLKDVWSYLGLAPDGSAYPGLDGLRLSSWTIQDKNGGTFNGPRAYWYDGLGRPSKFGEWYNIQHDAMGHLTSATSPWANTETFQYDKNLDNAIYHTFSGGSPSNTFAFSMGNPVSDYPNDVVGNNHVPGFMGSTSSGWTYNAFGEATTVGTTTGTTLYMTLGWDGLGRLANVKYASLAQTQTYTYDASGLRVKLVDTNTGNSRRYVYNAGGQLLAEYSANGATWNRNVVYLGGTAVAEVDSLGVVHELHCDPLGTPRVITKLDANNAPTTEGAQTFFPFGEKCIATGATWGYVPLAGFTGHLQTDATGLIYMRGRYYSPMWHRFVSSDHGADANSPNQYAYCNGSPFMFTDPSGMASEYSAFLYIWQGHVIDSGPIHRLGLSTFFSGAKLGWSDFTGIGTATYTVNNQQYEADLYMQNDLIIKSGNVTSYRVADDAQIVSSPSGSRLIRDPSATVPVISYGSGVTQFGADMRSDELVSYLNNGTWWQRTVENQSQVSVSNVVPTWLAKPITNVFSGISVVNTICKYRAYTIGGLCLELTSGSAIAGISGGCSVIGSGIAAYEGGTWVGSMMNAAGAGVILAQPPMEVYPGIRF